MAALQAVIFNVDGTLVDSDDAHAHAWVEALAEFGYRVGFVQARRKIGEGGAKVLPQLAGVEKESPLGKQISERRGQIFKERYPPRLQPFPSTRELLERLHAAGRKLVVASSSVASSSKEDEFKALLKVTGAPALFEASTSASDAQRSKSDPDIVQAALDRAGCAADEAVVIGDTPCDVEAAGRAGLRVIAVRCGGWDDEELQGAPATYDDPRDLLAHLDETPLGS
jgi:HAD superfamily hydrolase (TIGR01509 family)